MACANDLPVEIWRIILQLVPRGLGTNLHAVCRMFFEIVMARRYGSVRWGYYWFGSGDRDLYALKQVPLSFLSDE